jgi:hypothetical protein
MIKQLNLTILSLMLIALAGKAQSFKYDFSETTGTTRPSNNAVPVEGGWLTAQSKPSKKVFMAYEVELIHYNTKMEKINSVEIKLKSKRYFALKGLYYAKGEYNLIYGYRDGQFAPELHISGMRINPKDLSIKEEIDLGTVNVKSGYTMLTTISPDLDAFQFEYAIDSSRFFLLASPDQKKKDPKQFAFAVYNPDLSKMYSRNIELDVQARYAEIESTTLDQFGNFYVQRRTIPVEISSSYLDKDHSKYIPEETILTHFSKDGNAGTNLMIGLVDKYVYQTKITLNTQNNKLEIAGTYKNTQFGRLSGIFYCKYDPVSKKVSELVSSEVPQDIATVFANEKLAKIAGKDPGLSLAFNLKNISYRQNGSVDCMLEYQNAELHSMSAGGNAAHSSTYVKHMNYSILNVNIKPDGKMTYTRIPKRQMNTEDNCYLSFFSFYSGNKLILLYNEEKKNLEIDIDEMPKEIYGHKRGTALVAAIIDEQGKLRREVVYEHNEDKYVTLPKYSRMISGNDILITRTKMGKTFQWEFSKIGVLHIM